MKKRKQTPHLVDFSHKYIVPILWNRINSNLKEILNEYSPREMDALWSVKYSIVEDIKKLKMRDL